MDTVPQDAFATLELSEEGGEGLTGLARVLSICSCRYRTLLQANTVDSAKRYRRSRLSE